MSNFKSHNFPHLGAYVKAIGTLMILHNKSGIQCEQQHQDEIKALMMQEGVPEELADPKFAVTNCLD